MVSYIGTAELELEIPYGNGAYEYNHEYSGFPIGIAENTVIENAISGSGNDSITCNVAVNYIACGAGDDNVFNIGPGDYIFGGDGSDSFWIISLDFASIKGGVGANVFNGEGDMLVFDDYAGSTIDLRSFTDAQLTSIEDIDIEDGSATTLKISYQALLDLECAYTRDMDGDGFQDYVIYIHADSLLDEIQINDEGWSAQIPIDFGDNIAEGYDYYSSANGLVWFAFTTGTSVIINPDGNNYPAKTSAQTAPGDIEKPVVTPVDDDTPITLPDGDWRPAGNDQTHPGISKEDDFGSRGFEGDAGEIASEVNPLGSSEPEILIEGIVLPEIAPPDDSSALLSVEDTLNLLSELIDLTPSVAIDYQNTLLMDENDPITSAQQPLEHSTATVDLVADLPFMDDYNPMLDHDMLFWSSELGNG
jgi:hypothetical protein